MKIQLKAGTKDMDGGFMKKIGNLVEKYANLKLFIETGGGNAMALSEIALRNFTHLTTHQTHHLKSFRSSTVDQ